MSRIPRALIALTMAGAVLASAACGGTTPAPTAAPTAAPAQPTKAPVVNFPTKDINLIVIFKAGGGYDIQARMIAPFLEKYLPNKVNIVIKNVEGAAGKLGASELAQSKPDGHTIAMVGNEGVAFMGARGELDPDPATWSWLGQMSNDQLAMAIPTDSKYKTLADMKGQDIRFGTSSQMLPSIAVLALATGMKMRPVIIDGSGVAMLAAQRGDVDAVLFSFPTLKKGVADSQGKLTALFVVAPQRLEEWKELPTLGELGVKLDASSASVIATARVLVGPPNMDKAIKDIWETAIAKAMKDPEFLAQMAKAGQYPVYGDAAAALANLKSAEAAYKPIMELVQPFLDQ